MKTKTEEIRIEKNVVSRTYELSLGDYNIEVIVDNSGITLKNCHGELGFEFENSTPETLEAIGELIKQAGRLK